MKIVLELEELQLLPDNVREGLLSYIAEKASPQVVAQAHSRISFGRSDSNHHPLYAEVAARDGEKCAQCGDDSNLEVSFVVPPKLGGGLTVDNAQLLCGKHHKLKVHKSVKGNITTIGAISVEAAIALIEGLSLRSENLLKAMIVLGANSGIKRDELMDNPDLRLKFKDGRSLNGVLTAIRRRFCHLFTEGDRNSVDLFQYDTYQDTYSLGEGTYSSIKEAFKYFDDQTAYQKNREIRSSTVNLYHMGLGNKLEEFSFGGPHQFRETILVLPRTAGSNTSLFEENFNFDGNWVIYGKEIESEEDD